jgi:tRNA(fMet)-specific endonuclease VapC
VTLRFLLDTNVLSEPRRPRPDPAVVERLLALADAVAMPAPVWHELLFGVWRLPASPRKNALAAYLREVLEPSIPILAYDQAAAEWHARERGRLEAQGKATPFIDGQIAAIAAVNDLVLVTANTRDFRLFRGLRLEDWTKPHRG